MFFHIVVEMSNSKAAGSRVNYSVPRSVADFNQCVELVLGARRRGGLESVINRVRGTEDGLQTEFSAIGLSAQRP